MAEIVPAAEAALTVAQKSWKAILAAALVLAGIVAAEAYEHTFRARFLFWSVEGMGQHLVDVKPALAKAASDLKQCNANAGVLQSAIDKQNASITAWQTASDKATAAAQAAVQTASIASAAADKHVAAIMAEKGSTCADIHSLRTEN